MGSWSIIWITLVQFGGKNSIVRFVGLLDLSITKSIFLSVPDILEHTNAVNQFLETLPPQEFLLLELKSLFWIYITVNACFNGIINVKFYVSFSDDSPHFSHPCRDNCRACRLCFTTSFSKDYPMSILEFMKSYIRTYKCRVRQIFA